MTPLGPDHRRLWGSTVVSSFGDGVYLAALPLLAAGLTRDPLTLSLIGVTAWLPWVLFGALSGALADRMDRRLAMVGSDLARAAVVAVVAVAVLGGWASIPLLAVLAFLLGTGQTLFDTAIHASIPLVVGRDQARLDRANSQISGGWTAGRELLGPPAGGVLYALVAWVPFAVDALSFLVSAALVGGVRARMRPEAEPGPRAGLRAEIREGLAYLAGHRLLRVLVAVVGTINAVWAALDVVMVLFAQDELGLGAAGYGLLLAATAVGAVPGSLVAARVGRRLPTAPLLVGGVAVEAAAVLALGLAPNALVAGAALVAGGVQFVVWDVAHMSLRQQLIPDRLMGRVLGASRVVGFGVIPLGAALGGVVGRLLGVRAVIVAGAATLALLALVMARLVTSRAVAEAREAAGLR